MSNPLLDFVLELVSEGLHPHAVAVELVGGRWRCRVELDDWCAAGDGGDQLRHAVAFDGRNLPEGVSAIGRERFAPRVMPLELPTRERIGEWIAEVAAAGKAPDWAWVGSEHCLTKPVEWLREPLRTALLGKR